MTKAYKDAYMKGKYNLVVICLIRFYIIDMSKIIVANWKMNGASKADAASLVEAIAPDKNNQIIICPPFTLLDYIGNILPDGILLGAQDCHDKISGAYTGNISAEMLKGLGCKYVIIGHSERRAYHGESNYLLRDKITAAHEQGLIPIYCIGETLEQRESGVTNDVLSEQIEQGLPNDVPAIIAYEPVWAIGTGKTATSDIIAETHGFIAGILPEGTSILYGGSVKADNAGEIMSIAHVDGVLVGGASLDAASFNGIVKCC